MSNFLALLHQNKRLRLGLLVGGVLLAALLLMLGGWLVWSAFRPATTVETVAPAAPDEFLVLIAPFAHSGGEKYDFGAELAADLQQAAPEGLRVQMLAAAPDPAAIPELAASSHARAIITGAYDANAISAQLYFIPPETWPATRATTEGQTLLMPDFSPVQYALYAPRGLGHPLQYVQSWLLGQYHFWQGQYDAAQESFLMAQRLLPTIIPVAQRPGMDQFTASLLWALGYIKGPVQHDWLAAQGFFHRSMTLQGDALPAVLGLAAAKAQLHDVAGARDLLHRALREHPDDWRIYAALAQISAQHGPPEETQALFEQAITLLSDSDRPIDRRALADLYFNRGYFFYQQKDYESALADYQQARALGREDIYLLSNLGWTAYLLDENSLAVEASTQAAAIEPERPDLAFNKALHLLAAGRYDEASAAYDAAIQLTLKINDVLTRSTYFGAAYQDLADLAARKPELQPQITELQTKIDLANG